MAFFSRLLLSQEVLSHQCSVTLCYPVGCGEAKVSLICTLWLLPFQCSWGHSRMIKYSAANREPAGCSPEDFNLFSSLSLCPLSNLHLCAVLQSLLSLQQNKVHTGDDIIHRWLHWFCRFNVFNHMQCLDILQPPADYLRVGWTEQCIIVTLKLNQHTWPASTQQRLLHFVERAR